MLGLPFHVVFQLEDVTTVEELQELVDSEEPIVSFQGNSPYPKSNTCANTIYLSTIEMSHEKFLYYLVHGITNTAGFGSV